MKTKQYQHCTCKRATSLDEMERIIKDMEYDGYELMGPVSFCGASRIQFRQYTATFVKYQEVSISSS